MVIEWKSMLFVIVILFIALIIIKLVEKRANLKGEVKRKIFHITMGIFKSSLSVWILGVFAIGVMYVLKNTKLKQSIGSVLYSVDRESMGEIFFILSIFIIFYLSKGDKILYSIPILILTFADSVAALIGMQRKI